ncbi:MAG: TIGR03013 family PEP-CTERM/XrtA system glycosyltransferase [Methylococcales bacterium]
MIRIFRHYLSSAYVWLFFTEFVVLYFSMYWGAELRFFYTNSWYSDEYILLSSAIFAVVILISNVGLGLYRRSLSWDDFHLLSRIGVSFTSALLVLLVIYYSFPEFTMARSVLVYSFVMALLGILFCRYIFYGYAKRSKLRKKILVIGVGDNASSLVSSNHEYIHRGFQVVACLNLNNAPVKVKGYQVVSDYESILSVANNLDIDEIVMALDDRRCEFPMDDLLDCKVEGIEVVDLLSFYEREKSMIDLNNIYPSWFVFSDGFSSSGFRNYSKRMVDILASAALLLVSWPFMLIVACAIYIESGFKGPILYRQTRVGAFDKDFDVIKFRSMRTDAELNGAQWAQENDNRVTRVGGFIRKVRLDELPQIWNVFRGDMSFVGPRPERPKFVDQFDKNIPYYRKRHRVKPGITGWAQLCYPYGANEYDAIQKLQYDLYYVKNYSLFLDLTIIIHTIEIILWGKGAR